MIDSSSELRRNNPRANSVSFLITDGLGYCCENFFWAAFEGISSELIAARLGVARRTVNRHRQWWADGQLECAELSNCLLKRILFVSSSIPPQGAGSPDI